MNRYDLLPGTSRGLRITDTESADTVVLMGRTLDNLSEASAFEIIELLQRRDRLRRDHLQAAADRNELTPLFEYMQQASGA